MTTIAYKNGVLAADSRALYSGTEIAFGGRGKIWKTKDGRLIGITGVASPCYVYAVALSENQPLPEIRENCGCVIEVKRNGQVFEHSFGGYFSLGRVSMGAWGSGSMAAKAALLLGCSAKDAVEIAKKCDACTGGKTTTVSLKASKGRASSGRKKQEQ